MAYKAYKIGLYIGGGKIAAAQSEYSDLRDLRLNQNGDIVIPEEFAYNGEVFRYFIAAPQCFDERIGRRMLTRREVLSAFFKKLMEDIKKYNAIDEDDNITLYIGCPNVGEWREGAEIFKKMVRQAAGIENVYLEWKSVAVIFNKHWRKRRKDKPRIIAVLYFGSVTADFMYVEQTGGWYLDEKQIGFSWDLGTRAIEKNLRKMMYEKALALARGKGLSLAPENQYAALEAKLWEKKEAYFDGELTEDTCKMQHTFQTREGIGIDVELSINEETLRQALEEKKISIRYEKDGTHYDLEDSWSALCRKFICEAEEYWTTKGIGVHTVVLAGGGTRMGIVEAYAREIIYTHKSIYNDIFCIKNTHFCVSRGLVAPHNYEHF